MSWPFCSPTSPSCSSSYGRLGSTSPLHGLSPLPISMRRRTVVAQCSATDLRDKPRTAGLLEGKGPNVAQPLHHRHLPCLSRNGAVRALRADTRIPVG